MNAIKRILVVAVVAICVSSSAMAQFAWGPKVGLNVSNIHFNKEIVGDLKSSENRAGFTAGLMMEYMFPVLNLGFDASLMYVHRTTGNEETVSRDYLELPINFKYKIGLPVVGKIITPYVFTGPSFAVLVGKNNIAKAFQSKTFDMAWNVGLGLQLFTKLQIGASYSFGMIKAVSSAIGVNEANEIEGKNRYWTVTAAWLF